MRSLPAAFRLLRPLACLALVFAVLGDFLAARAIDQVAAPRESLQREGKARAAGRLVLDRAGKLVFADASEGARGPITLEPGAVVTFPTAEYHASSLLPLFQVLVGESARISGQIRSIGAHAVGLAVPWQSAEVRVARPGVQAVLQRPGEARVFVEPFLRIDPARWTITGKPELVPDPDDGTKPGGVKLPAGGASLLRRIDEPPIAGRLELSFRDEGRIVAGQQWMLDVVFRGASGPATLRIVLGWGEESLAVESPDGPSLPVQRLARTAGSHRLAVRFGPDQLELSVDAKELAYGKGPAGPLESIRIATSPTTGAGEPPSGLAGLVREVQLVRFAEPPASLEIDPSQDEARLVLGDQLYGMIRESDAERVAIVVGDRPVLLDWSRVAGLHFRRTPAAGTPVEGALARVEWLDVPGAPARELDFAEGAVTALSDATITLATPYAGKLTIPRDRLVRLRVLDPGWFQVIDPAAHHLGDNISSSPPLLDPPLPEGGVLERSFELKAVTAAPTFLVLDVVQVVGETAGTPYSNLVQKGELRTNVAINGRRVDYLNRFITTTNETPERVRIPIPKGLLRAGRNTLRIEQIGTSHSPEELDDLGILQIGLHVPSPEKGASSRTTGNAPSP
jgi:hypothetical protein